MLFCFLSCFSKSAKYVHFFSTDIFNNLIIFFSVNVFHTVVVVNMFNYVYMYMYIVILFFMSFPNQHFQLCKPLSKLDLPTLLQGSSEKRTQWNKLINC